MPHCAVVPRAASPDQLTAVTTNISLAGKLSLWAVALLAITLSNHTRDVLSPESFVRTVKISDFMRLYVTGAIASGGSWDRLYDPAFHAKVAKEVVDPSLEMAGLIPNYGPSAAAILSPLSSMPILQAWILLTLLTLFVFMTAVGMTAQDENQLSSYFGTLMLLALASPALAVTLRYGQLSGVTTSLFLLAVALHRRKRDVFSGVCVGLCFFKPQFVVPALVVFLTNREGRLLAGLALGIMVHLCVGVAVAGITPTVEWFELLLRLASDPRQVQGFATDAHSFHGFWRLAGLSPPWLGFITAACAVLLITAAALHWRISHTFARWGTLTLATVLASPHLLTYDLLLLTVPLLLATPTWFGNKITMHTKIVLAAAVYLSPFISPLMASMIPLQYSTVAATWLFGQLLVQDRETNGQS